MRSTATQRLPLAQYPCPCAPSPCPPLRQIFHAGCLRLPSLPQFNPCSAQRRTKAIHLYLFLKVDTGSKKARALPCFSKPALRAVRRLQYGYIELVFQAPARSRHPTFPSPAATMETTCTSSLPPPCSSPLAVANRQLTKT